MPRAISAIQDIKIFVRISEADRDLLAIRRQIEHPVTAGIAKRSRLFPRAIEPHQLDVFRDLDPVRNVADDSGSRCGNGSHTVTCKNTDRTCHEFRLTCKLKRAWIE